MATETAREEVPAAARPTSEQLRSALRPRRWLVAAACAAIAAAAAIGCAKDGRLKVAELVAHLENVREWRYDVEAAKTHAPWLQANIAWDIVGAQTMTSMSDLGSLPANVDEVLKSGLAEVAAGPSAATMISHLDRWRDVLGNESCAVSPAATDDATWLAARLAMPVPAGASAETRATLEAYAKRAAAVHDPLRITCGSTAVLVVGKLDGKLVPVLRE